MKFLQTYKRTVKFMKYVEDRSLAEAMLQEAALSNPGPWVDHSYNVAKAAELIAFDLRQA
jgi:hypothetical protein